MRRVAEELARSRARERVLERRAHNRLRIVVAVLALSAVLGSVLTAFAVVQRNDARRQARVATARELAAASRTALGEVRPSDTDGVRAPSSAFRLRCALCAVNDLEASSDGRLLGWAAGYHARGWDLEEGEELFDVVTDDVVSSVAWTPDQRHIAIAGRTHVRVVEVDGTTEFRWPIERPDGIDDEAFDTFVEFSPDGTLLAVGAGVGLQPNAARVELWDWREQALVRVLDTRPWGNVPASSPDGSWIAVGSRDEPVGIFDVKAGELIGELPDDSARVRVLATSPDGILATAGHDRVVRLWDVSTGQMQLELPEHEGEVVELDFSHDSTRLISSDDAGKVHVWALDLDELIDIAEERVTRGLTLGECLQFLGQPSCPEA